MIAQCGLSSPRDRLVTWVLETGIFYFPTLDHILGHLTLILFFTLPPPIPSPPATLEKPILSLHPPWTTIFKGEKVTLRCDGYHPLLLELQPISTLWYLGHLLLPSYKKSIEVHTPGVYRCQTRGAPVSDPIHLSVSNGECLNTGGAAHVLWQGCPSCGRGHGATCIGVEREGYIESAWHYVRDALRLA